MDLNAQFPSVAPDGHHDRLCTDRADGSRPGVTRLPAVLGRLAVGDRVGDELAGQQHRDIHVDRDPPGADRGPDVLASLGRRAPVRREPHPPVPGLPVEPGHGRHFRRRPGRGARLLARRRLRGCRGAAGSGRGHRDHRVPSLTGSARAGCKTNAHAICTARHQSADVYRIAPSRNMAATCAFVVVTENLTRLNQAHEYRHGPSASRAQKGASRSMTRLSSQVDLCNTRIRNTRKPERSERGPNGTAADRGIHSPTAGCQAAPARPRGPKPSSPCGCRSRR